MNVEHWESREKSGPRQMHCFAGKVKVGETKVFALHLEIQHCYVIMAETAVLVHFTLEPWDLGAGLRQLPAVQKAAIHIQDP